MESNLRFEGMVGLKKDKNDIILKINDTSLLFEKKGVFTKEYKLFKEIVIKDIKVLKDIPMVEYNDGEMTIHTVNEIFKLYCSYEIHKKIMTEIKNNLGLGFMKTLEKTGEMIEEGINDAVDAAKGFIKEVSESEAVKEGTKAVKDAFNGMVDSINKIK